MEIPVLIEPVLNSGFRAICGEPLCLESEAPTREEAIRKLRQRIGRRMANGAEVIAVPIDNSSHPPAAFAGTLKDDSLVEPWKQAMADYRS